MWMRFLTKLCALRSKNELKPWLKEVVAFLRKQTLLLYVRWKMCWMFTSVPMTQNDLRSAWKRCPNNSWVRNMSLYQKNLDNLQSKIMNMSANIFMLFEPLAGKRFIETNSHRRSVDWAHGMKVLSDVLDPDAEGIVLVMDNLNTHKLASFYEVFEPEEAQHLSRRFEIHYTPKHDSWLNMAEIELSALVR